MLDIPGSVLAMVSPIAWDIFIVAAKLVLYGCFSREKKIVEIKLAHKGWKPSFCFENNHVADRMDPALWWETQWGGQPWVWSGRVAARSHFTLP